MRCIQCILTLLLSYQKQRSDNFSDFSSEGETRGVKKLPDVEKEVKKILKENPYLKAKWYKKMGGRSFVITCSAFGDTRLYSVRQQTVRPSCPASLGRQTGTPYTCLRLIFSCQLVFAVASPGHNLCMRKS